jgi:hypothetical protein
MASVTPARRTADAESAQGERWRKYAKRFHPLSAWKYGIMMEPERLNWEPTPVRRGYTSSRSGY